MNRKPISQREIARNVRFQPHPTMTACWVWTGRVDRGTPTVAASGYSARQDVYERILGNRPGGNLKPACGTQLCVNPGHMRNAVRSTPASPQ